MAEWIFREILPEEVETEVTQRDQFRNDELDLSDTVVREAVQNSLDAQAGDTQVVVRFATVSDDDHRAREFLATLLADQLAHAEAAGLDVSGIWDSPKVALVIEDFGTRGLTGAVDQKDNDNFSDFWRRHGRSHKSGQKRGRWGLGKLVYSYSSRIGVFFGLTQRVGDRQSYLMGQTVLNGHTTSGATYAPHGFYAELKKNPPSRLPIPITDREYTKNFSESFGLRRTEEAGLSIVILWPGPDINLERMTGKGVDNYFFPILTDQLVLEFGDVRVDRHSLRNIAARFGDGDPDRGKLFDFVEAVHKFPRESLPAFTSAWYDDWRLSESDIPGDLLQDLREKHSRGELIGLRLPIVIRRKSGEKVQSHFYLFLRSDPGLVRGHDLYIRGGITVPGEAQFRSRKAIGALLATDGAVCEFLGDAENASHTRWNGRAEKVTANYQQGPNTLKAIRNSLVELYDILAQKEEEESEDALMDFFSAPGRQGARPTKAKGHVTTSVTTEVKVARQPIEVRKVSGGFSLAPTQHIGDAALPLVVLAEVAYDLPSGNPFSKYSPLDFDLGGAPMEINVEGAEMVSAADNALVVRITNSSFGVTVKGFDANRDIVVRVRSEEDDQ